MKVVIGLAGVKTAGKSTVANMIQEFVVNANESALADKLKNVSAEVFGLERRQFDAQELKEVPFVFPKTLTMSNIMDVLMGFGVNLTPQLEEKYLPLVDMKLDTPRKIAQIVGTEILRATGNEDIHCDNVKIHETGVTIISDLRFPNEFAYFSKKEGVKFIPLYVQRDLAEIEVTENSHPSEKCVFEFSEKCIKIDNNKSLSNTERQVKEILDRELL